MQIIVIDNYEQLQSFLVHIKDSDVIIHPVFNWNIESIHVKLNNICIISFYVMKYDVLYVFLNEHIDRHTEIPITDIFELVDSYPTKKFVYDKKRILHVYEFDNLIDTNLLYYLKHNISYDSKNNIPINNFYPYYIQDKTLINKITPVYKLVDICQNNTVIQLKIISDTLDIIDTKPFKFNNDLMLKCLFQIEAEGLKVDKDIFIEHIGEDHLQLLSNDDFIYSEYYPYTVTGRPSNRFGGINFAALNKSDGTRDMICSRFDGGMLMELDFDAYHLNLMAKLTGYELPEGISMHEYLGQYYFDKLNCELTPEEYNKSKEISFRILYGSHIDEFVSIPFFEHIYEFIKTLWVEFNSDNKIYAPISARELHKHNYKDINMHKLFNYYLQLVETEFSLTVINSFLNLITKYNYNSKLILYTYDSFLFDCKSTEMKFITDIKSLLDGFNLKYKLKIGTTYSQMKKVTFKKDIL